MNRNLSIAPTRILLAFVLFLFVVPNIEAGEASRRHPLAVIRFGNVDAVDAEDGPLGRFVRSIRNDSRFIPPLHTLAGAEIRNPTFFGIAYEAWMECVVLVPENPGAADRVWVFPVDSRDEYLAHLVGAGLSEYEGMDGITVLREHLPGGGVHTWHLEWLPGNVAVFGEDRASVAAARTLYAENSASRGLLAGAGGQFVDPDLLVRLEPSRLAAWQNRAAGEFWWRSVVEQLARDLKGYWRPSPSRARLIDSVAEHLVAWPRHLGAMDFSVWFEHEGVEWRARIAQVRPGVASTRSLLPALRRMPERTSFAFAVPVTTDSFERFGDGVGEWLIAAAGGAVTGEARQAARALLDILAAGGATELASGWIAPPAQEPELGAVRLLVMEWERPELLSAAWEFFQEGLAPDSPAVQVFAQMGWNVAVERVSDDDQAVIAVIRPYEGGTETVPYYDALAVFRAQENRMALAVGTGRTDELARERVTAYRAGLAAEAVAGEPEGIPDVRRAFVRMGNAGSGFLGFCDPVRFAQMCLVEAADWRPLSPDQEEPLSVQLAREMLEYAGGEAWTFEGNAAADGWDVRGGMSWRSLMRLSAALGITEAIGLEIDER